MAKRDVTSRLHITRGVRDKHHDAQDTAHDGEHVSVPKLNATPEPAAR